MLTIGAGLRKVMTMLQAVQKGEACVLMSRLCSRERIGLPVRLQGAQKKSS